MCPYKICILFCMCMFKDNSYKNNACVCYLLLCNKWSRNNSRRHIYYLSVSMGQDSRHGLPLTLSGSLTGYNHLQVQLGRICILVHSVVDGRIQGLTRLLAGCLHGPELLARGLPPFFAQYDNSAPLNMTAECAHRGEC